MGQKLHHQCFWKKKKNLVIVAIKSFVLSPFKLTHKKLLMKEDIMKNVQLNILNK